MARTPTSAAKKKGTKKTAAKKTTETAATKTKKKAAKKAAAKKAAAKKAPAKKAEELDLDEELSVENLMARAGELEREREERAADERGRERELRPPVAARPSNPVHWGYPFCLDEALPKEERAALAELFGRFTELKEEPSSGFFIVAPETEPERRRAAWDDGGVVLEVEQLRAQLPPEDLDARRERLAQALARPSSEAWSEAGMLLSTWDPATLPQALAEAEKLLAGWPDEMRTRHDAWAKRPELLRLVRVHWGPLAEVQPEGITVVKTQDPEGLLEHQERLAGVKFLDISGKTGLPAVVTRCTALRGLERLALQQPTYTEGTASLDLTELLRAPHLQRLEGLSLYGYRLSPADLRALAEGTQRLKFLRLHAVGMKPAAAAALARVAARTRLQTLDVKYSDLGPKGAQALFASPGDWETLRALDISANEIGDEGVAALTRASLSELRWLNISSNDPANQLTAKAARALAESPALGKLETLILHGHPIGAEGVAALVQSPCLRSLRALNVAFPGTNLRDIAAHLGSETTAPLEVVNLGHVDSSRGRLDLRAATFLRGVRSLGLDSLDGKEYAAVLDCPHLGSLEVLILGGAYSNQPAAFKALCAATPPPRLRYLELRGWKFTAERARELAASPLGRQLWGLDLMASYTVPDAWYEFYRAGLPLVGSPLFDAYAPSEHDTTTLFREEV